MFTIPTIVDEPINVSCLRIIPILILILVLLAIFQSNETFISKPVNNLPKYNMTADLSKAKTLDIKTRKSTIIRNIAIIADDEKSTIYELRGNKLPSNVRIKSIIIDSPNLNNAIVKIKDKKGAVIWTNTSPVNRINDAYVITFEKAVYPTKQQVLDPNLSVNMQEQFLFYYR
jgi:hypothetical protein